MQAVHLFITSFNQSSNQSINQSFNHSFIQSFIHSLIHWAGGNEERAEGGGPRARMRPPPPSPDPSSCPSRPDQHDVHARARARPAPLGASPCRLRSQHHCARGGATVEACEHHQHHCARAGTNLRPSGIPSRPPKTSACACRRLTGRCTRAGCS